MLKWIKKNSFDYFSVFQNYFNFFANTQTLISFQTILEKQIIYFKFMLNLNFGINKGLKCFCFLSALNSQVKRKPPAFITRRITFGAPRADCIINSLAACGGTNAAKKCHLMEITNQRPIYERRGGVRYI
jgi:hypothetical protein